MSLWTVKLSPSGGVLRWPKKESKLEAKLNELPERFRKAITKRGVDKIKDSDCSGYCRKHGVIGIGWSVEPRQDEKEITWEDYYKDYINNGKKEGWLKPRTINIIKQFHNIEVDDLCWVRDENDYYYVCKITGKWKYINNPVNWAMDIVQIHECKWKKVGNATQVPAGIVRKLITIGDTVSKVKVDDEKNVDYDKLSEFLFNSEEGTVQKYVNKFNGTKDVSADFINNLTQYEYEDLVGFYLQHEYYIMPSTRTQSTKDYEFVLINKIDYHIAAVQVKAQNKPISAKEYEKKFGSFDKFYLACTKGVVDIENKGKIIEIKNEDLLQFFRDKTDLLPDRIKFMAVYFKEKKVESRGKD